MAYISVLAQRLEPLIVAQGWQCRTDRFTMRTVEPALTPIDHTWMVGESSAMLNGEIQQVRPDRIIVQDDVSRKELERVEAAMEASGREPNVERYTYFVDRLWDASRAAERARRDAQLQDQLFEALTPDGFQMPATPSGRHVTQLLKLGGMQVADHWLFETALSVDGSWLAVFADAGQGKSELLQWLEWDRGVQYESDRNRQLPELRPVALRVPLRDLHTLSLDAIAHYLSRPDPDHGLPALTRIGTGKCLEQLLIMGRVILLLDGVDELMISREKLEAGLRQLRDTVNKGARLLFSARSGDQMSRGALGERFAAHEIAEFVPMSADDARKLLVKYGADRVHAETIVKRLNSSPTQRIPLFVLMAYAVDLSAELEPEVLQSRTRVLEVLLTLFCERDEPRLGVSTNDQMRLLTALAQWTCLESEPTPALALEVLGVDSEDREAAIVDNPHALLIRSAAGTIQFKYPQFVAYFAARAIAEDWARSGFEFVMTDLRKRKLDEGTVECLTRLIEDCDLLQAWAIADGRDDVHRSPLIRRNLLAMALARLDDDVPGGSPAMRSAHLASLLGGRRLEDVSLSDLSLVRLDLADWTVARIQGRGGSMQYCVNLDRCQYDDSILTLDNHEGTEFPAEVDEQALLTAGGDRLSRLIRPLRRRNSNTFIPMLNVSECRDNDAWQLLRRAGLARQERRGMGGERCWVMNENGIVIVNAFLTARDDASPAVLVDLLHETPTLRTLLLTFAA